MSHSLISSNLHKKEKKKDGKTLIVLDERSYDDGSHVLSASGNDGDDDADDEEENSMSFSNMGSENDSDVVYLLSNANPRHQTNFSKMEPCMADETRTKKGTKSYLKKKYRSELLTQIFIFVSMCMHSVIAGIGASFGSSSKTVLAFVIISFMVHKVMDVAIVAKGLIELRVRRLVYVTFIFTFAFMTPVGMLMGAYIKGRNLDSTSLVFLYFLQLFTGGIFLYIAVIEIFIEHFIQKPNKFKKFFVFLIFYSVTSLIAYVD